MLEEKVQELLEVRKRILRANEDKGIALEDLNTKCEALPGYRELVEDHDKKFEDLSCTILEETTRKNELEAEILAAMTEKTHKLECATITKKEKSKLSIKDEFALYDLLQKEDQLEKVKGFKFDNNAILKFKVAGGLKKMMPKIAEITTTESLAITAKK